MGAGQGEVTRDGALVHADEPSGGPGAAALPDVVQDGEDLGVGQSGQLQKGPLAFGELGLAGASGDHTDPLVFTTPAAKGAIPAAPEPGLGALGILATEVLGGMQAGPLRS